MNNDKLHVLIIGTGAYVCGRGTPGLGTVLPACFEARRADEVASLSIASRHGQSFNTLEEKYRKLSADTGVELPYRRFPEGSGRNPRAYLDAILNLPAPGAVIVATPDDNHHAMALAALRAGKHVLVVKPLTPKTTEALELVREAEKRGVHGAVDYHKRWDWANLQLRQQFRDGRIGKPLFFQIEYSQQRWIPEKAFASWIDTTNIFQYLGVHYVDAIHWITGAKPVRASATAQSVRLKSLGFKTPDSIQATIEWAGPNKDGTFASTFLIHWVDPDNTSAVTYQSIKLIGTNGRIESDQKNRGLEVISEAGGIANPNPYFCAPYPGPKPGQLQWQGYGIDSIRQFIDDARSVASGRTRAKDLAPHRPSFRQALVATAVSEAVTKSLSQNGRWVTVRGKGIEFGRA